jgi:imidazolonepropionase-like amidohydrolase
VIVLEGERITGVGPRTSVAMPRDVETVDLGELTLLPGLMDMHVHLGAQAGNAGDLARRMMTQRSLELLWSVPNSRATLDAGFTTVRDAGLTPAGVRDAVERGLFAGPRMQVAVSILSQTGGHADDFMPCGAELPLGSMLDIPLGRVDGVDEMRRRVREVLRAGADWIKLCTSGGVLSPGDTPQAAQFTVEEIRAAVSEAAAQGKRCMAHAMSAAGIKNALEAGVVSIEHGCFLDEEGISMMRAKGAYLVPTLVAPVDVIEQGERNPGRVPPPMLAKAKEVAGYHRRAFQAAVQAGVQVAMGTDSGVGEHGRNARELVLMVEGGMTPLQAISATTKTPAELLGLGDRLGTLEPGKVADFIAVPGDPASDIRVFEDRTNVKLVVKGGRTVVEQPVRQLAAAL